MEILIEGLSHVYLPKTPFERQALTDIHLQIPSGSFVAVIGQTGSGKSTLIQLISGLLKPMQGTIQVGPYHISARTKSLAPLRKHVGVVFQYPEHQLFEETVARDIAFGLRQQGLSPEEIQERVLQAMEWVGLPLHLKDRSPFQLSGGQMRRVAIAGVLAMNPDILVLDEPTAGLDYRGQQDLLTMIHQLHHSRQMTVILVTHNMDEAARYAELLYIMNDGRCVHYGKPEEVFSQVSKLESWGLDIPEISRLILQLNEKLEPPLPLSIFSLDELERYLLKRQQQEGST